MFLRWFYTPLDLVNSVGNHVDKVVAYNLCCQVLHLLRRYLGEYVHGLSVEALRISVWKGLSSDLWGA